MSSFFHLDRHSTLSFSIQPFEEVLGITPVVNGVPLTEMVLKFEIDERFEPTGGYGGLIPQWFKYGPLDHYFLGKFEGNVDSVGSGRIYLLGCGECGDVGCWPLTARITADLESVIWDCFHQPHRPQRDYSKFGPFVFEAHQYREAVAAICFAVSSQAPQSVVDGRA